MSLDVNSNSYISADEANAFVSENLLSAENQRVAWELLSTDDKELYLKRAAEEIESLKFVGIKYDEGQKMAFPRKYILHEDEEVPQNVKDAQVLEALELASPSSDTDMAQAYSGNVRSYSLGSISESYKTSESWGVKAKIKSVRAQRLLQPYLGGGYRVR